MTSNQTTKVWWSPLDDKTPSLFNPSVYATCYCVFHCMLPSWVRKSILFDLFWGTGQWPSPEPQTTWISGIFQQPEDCMLWWSFDIGVVFHELDKLTDFVQNLQSGHSLFCAWCNVKYLCLITSISCTEYSCRFIPCTDTQQKFGPISYLWHSSTFYITCNICILHIKNNGPTLKHSRNRVLNEQFFQNSKI